MAPFLVGACDGTNLAEGRPSTDCETDYLWGSTRPPRRQQTVLECVHDREPPHEGTNGQTVRATAVILVENRELAGGEEPSVLFPQTTR